MKGYPKKLNTIEDYEYVRNNFPEDQWKKDWQALLDSELEWYPTGTVKSKDAGIVDATHKVTEETNDETEEVTYMQWELKVNPTCKMNRLGFSEDYVKQVLGE